MAGYSPPDFVETIPVDPRPQDAEQLDSRTRRCHGALNLAGVPLVVYGSRRATVRQVILVLGSSPWLDAKMSTAQARMLARSLAAAADAVDGRAA